MTPGSIERNALRLNIYLGESDRWRGKPLYVAILETLKEEGVAGATVVRGVAGFGAHSRIHTATILRLSEDLPLRIEVVDSPDKISHAIEVISPMVREGLITVDEVQVIKYTHRYLNPLPADRTVGEVMTRDIVTLTPDMTIAQAWERMLEHQMKALPVINEREEVIGLLTDEDLLSRAGVQQRLSVAKRLDASILREELASLASYPLKVADVMNQPAITARVTEPLGAVASKMVKSGLKRVPVVDENGKLSGVLSRVDVLRQVVEAEPRSRRTEIPAGAAHTVNEFMDPQIPVIHQDDLIADIIAALVEFNTHRLIVVDQEGYAIGLISDGDVVARVQLKERRGVLSAFRGGSPAPPSELTARDVMSPGVLTATPETEIADAVNMMLAEGRKWLVIVDWEGKPLGLIDRQILLKAISHA
jgi:CBS-domain-containing membrane protein/PII-like signaling protein